MHKDSKMNVVAHAHLSFQILTLLQKYLYCQSQYSKPLGSKCLALIAEISDTFTRTSIRESKIYAVARAQLTSQMFTLLQRELKH